MSGFWIRINPQGCVEGSVYPEFLAEDSAEGAHIEFTPERGNRLYEAAHGWRHERVDRAEWQRRARPCLTGTCTHPAATAA